MAIKYTLEEYGETYVLTTNKWYGKISKKHLELLEMFSVQASHITEDPRFLNLYLEHHNPTILSGRLWERNTTKSYRFRLFVSTQLCEKGYIRFEIGPIDDFEAQDCYESNNIVNLKTLCHRYR